MRGNVGLLLLVALAGCGRSRPAAPAEAPLCPGAPLDEAPPPARAPRQAIQGSHADAITAMRFSADGRYLATASEDQTIKVWDAATHALVRTFQVPTEWVAPELGVAWDGARIVYSHWGEPTASFDLATGAREERPGLALSPLVQLAGGGWAGLSAEDVAGAASKQNVLVRIDAAGARTVRPVPRRVNRLAASRGGETLAGWVRLGGEPGDGDVLVWRGEAEVAVRTGGEEVGAVALTPAGDELLAAVRRGDAWSVAVYRLGRGEPAQRCVLSGVSHVPKDVVVSESGDLAAVVSDGLVGAGATIAVWDLALCAESWRIDEGSATAPERALFSPDGSRLVVASLYGDVRSFDADGGRERGGFGSLLRAVDEIAIAGDGRLATSATRDLRAWSLADARPGTRFDLPSGLPSGRTLAVGPGGEMVTMVTTFTSCERGRTLQLAAWGAGDAPPAEVTRAWPPRAGQTFEVCAPELRIQSAALASGALLAVVDDRPVVLRLATGAVHPLQPVAEGWVPRRLHMELSGDARWAVIQDRTVFHAWDATTGAVLRTLAVAPGDPTLSAIAEVATFAADSSAIAVGSDEVIEILALPGFARTHRITAGTQASALAFGPAGGLLIVGGRDGAVEAYRDGARVWRNISDGGRIEGLALAPAGDVVASQSADGAVRVWDLRNGALRGTLADFADEEWVITTPGGAFAGTAEVGDRVGWVFDDPIEHFGFEQFAAAFRRPDLVQRRLGGATVDLSGRPRRPPHVALTARPLADGRASLRAQVTGGARVDVVRAFVEGRPVAARPLCRRAGAVELEVPLGAGVNRVGVAAFDARGLASNLASVDLRGPARAAKPDAWVVAVGVSDYPRLPRPMQLAAADDDARGIAAAFERMRGATYREVHATTLVDAAATPAAIRAALDGLATMRPEDVAVVFLAGHGFKPDARADMVFATGGAAMARGGRGLTAETLRDHALSWADIARGISRARGRVVVLLDACHAGHVSQELVVANDRLADALVRQERAGAVVFAAAKGRQQSFEITGGRGLVLRPAARRSAAPSHGFFTGAFLRALDDPGSDRNRDGALQLSEIIDDVTRRVAAASDGAQTPWVARRDLFGDFTLAAAPGR